MHYSGSRSRREKGAKGSFKEIMAEKLPNLGKDTSVKIQEVHTQIQIQKIQIQITQRDSH